MEALELATKVAKILGDKKASDVKVLQVQDLTVLTDYFVIATGTSTTHVGSLANDVDYELGKLGIEPKTKEGTDSRTWILLDYGSVVVNVFTPDSRDFYSLERLWGDAEPVEIEFDVE